MSASTFTNWAGDGHWVVDFLHFSYFIRVHFFQFNPTAMLKHLSRIAVGTFGWYFWVNLFVFIEELTGQCEGEETLSSKMTCSLQGFHLDGLNTSGNVFPLTNSTPLIYSSVKKSRLKDGGQLSRETQEEQLVLAGNASFCQSTGRVAFYL